MRVLSLPLSRFSAFAADRSYQDHSAFWFRTTRAQCFSSSAAVSKRTTHTGESCAGHLILSRTEWDKLSHNHICGRELTTSARSLIVAERAVAQG
jgi:hypothetical protein